MGFAVILLRNNRDVGDVVIFLQIQGWPLGASSITSLFFLFFFFFFFFISQFRVHSSSIEFLGFSGMYIKIGDDTSKLWVIREHDSMYKFIQKIDIKPSVNSSIVRLVHEFIQHFNFK